MVAMHAWLLLSAAVGGVAANEVEQGVSRRVGSPTGTFPSYNFYHTHDDDSCASS